MKALLVSAAAAGLIVATPAFAQAGPSATAQGVTADATIVQPIAVNQTQGLNFGSIAAEAGTVTVTAAGASSSSPGMLVPGATPAAGIFAVTGEPGLSYTNTVDAHATLTNTADSTATMVADLTPSAAGGTLSSPGGGDTFNVGGVLHVAAGQKPGSYHGSYNVSVQYN